MELLTLVWKWYLSRVFITLSVSRKKLGAQGFLFQAILFSPSVVVMAYHI